SARSSRNSRSSPIASTSSSTAESSAKCLPTPPTPGFSRSLQGCPTRARPLNRRSCDHSDHRTGIDAVAWCWHCRLPPLACHRPRAARGSLGPHHLRHHHVPVVPFTSDLHQHRDVLVGAADCRGG